MHSKQGTSQKIAKSGGRSEPNPIAQGANKKKIDSGGQYLFFFGEKTYIFFKEVLMISLMRNFFAAK